MKIVIDCSNLYAGGGIQVAVSFLNDLMVLDERNEYHIIVSVRLATTIKNSAFDERFIFHSLHEREQNSILSRIKTLRLLESSIQPDVIFTVFGPSYHKSKFPKVVGFAWGYLIYPESPFYKQISFTKRAKYYVMNKLKAYFFKRFSDALVFETVYAKNYYSKEIDSFTKTYYNSNTLNAIFYKRNQWLNVQLKKQARFNVLLLSANYLHKNFAILPYIIDALKTKCQDFCIHLSIDKTEFRISEEHNKYINFMGHIPLQKLPSLYEQMDTVLMPTLLETFSTTYLEAMYMRVPIIASDLAFARDICGDAALYCDPLSAKEYADAIYEIYSLPERAFELQEKGTKNLMRFGTSMDRTKKYLEIIKETSINYAI